MHSFNAPSGRTYHHNGDFSGAVKFDAQVEMMSPTSAGLAWVEVPFEDLRALVAEYARRERISRLEEMSDDEVLGLPPAASSQ